MPAQDSCPVSVDIIMGTYGEDRIKEMTQKRRCTTTRKVVIGGPDQAMPKIRDWGVGWGGGGGSDSDNKTELIKFIMEYCKSVNVTASDETWLINSTEIFQLPSRSRY